MGQFNRLGFSKNCRDFIIGYRIWEEISKAKSWTRGWTLFWLIISENKWPWNTITLLLIICWLAMFNGGVSLTQDSQWRISGDSWIHLKVFPYTNLAPGLGRLQWLDGGFSVCVVFLCGCPWVSWLLMWNLKACRANVPRKTIRHYLAFSHLSSMSLSGILSAVLFIMTQSHMRDISWWEDGQEFMGMFESITSIEVTNGHVLS